MNNKTGILAILLIGMSLMLGSVHEAQAKRLGGGSSFGGKPSYSQPFQHPTTPNSSSQPTHSTSQQLAAGQNQAARQNWANRGGLMGMLGGLALGGLLGSLFFGGAFEHINVMDFLIFAGVAYLAYRLIAARTTRQNQPLGNAYGRSNYQQIYGKAAKTGQISATPAGFDTDLLFNKESHSNAAAIPADFDQAGFLTGAERAFRHLQAAWDNRDLASIRGLTTDKVFAEIQDQLRASSSANKTEVLKLKAELLDVREVGAELEATVLFDSLMREDGGLEEAIQEVWHFIKPKNSQQPKWFLDGIQQIEK